MKLNEFVRSIDVWTSKEEKAMLEKVNELKLLAGFTDHEQVVIEHLIRKSLLIKVESNGLTYVYPNS